MIQGKIVKLRAIKESIWINNVIVAENEHTYKKLKRDVDVYDIEAWNSFWKVIVIYLIIKCANGTNLYIVRLTMMNSNEIGSEYSQYSYDKLSNYVVKYEI